MRMHFLGKHAAYRINLTKLDFQKWDGILAARGSETQKNEMSQAARWNLDVFRRGNPKLFYKLYAVPPEKQTDQDWFSCMDVYSHPYDPLLLLTFVSIQQSNLLFVADKVCGHTLVGNTSRTHGVLDTKLAQANLCTLIGEGITMLKSSHVSSDQERKTPGSGCKGVSRPSED